MTFAEFICLFIGLVMGGCIGLVTFGLLNMAKLSDQDDLNQ
jgi:hypothetical protein